MNNNVVASFQPAKAWTGLLVFLLPSLCLVTLFGVSLTSYLLLLTALFLFKDCRAALVRHWHASRWVVLAFLFHFAFALLCYLLRPEATPHNVEKPARMFFAVSALALVLALRPPRRVLWWGTVVGAAGALALVCYQRFGLGIDRPGGFINAITFGDIVLCMALVAVAAAIDVHQHARVAAWPALGALAGLVAALLTGTRGGLVALAPAAVLFARHGHLVPGRRLRVLLAAGCLLCASAFLVPAVGLQARVTAGLGDLQAWSDGSNKNTSLGIRLELWRGAAMLAAEHPLSGVDHNVLNAQLERLVQQGKIAPVVLTMPHLHNDALQALVTGGIVGLVAWFSLLAAPFLFFARALKAASAGAVPQLAPALAGVLVVLSYACFGLTEVSFWSVKSSLFYSLMVFFLMGFCLNSKEQIGK